MAMGLRRSMIIPVITLATFFVLSVNAGGKNYCKYSLDKPLCEKIIKGAPDFKGVINKAITHAMTELERVSNTDEKVCKESYDNTHDMLEDSLNLVKNGDKDKSLSFKLSAALTSLEDCNNEIEDLKGDVAASIKKNTDLDLAIRVCLAVERFHREG